jgi:hypothetical protein
MTRERGNQRGSDSASSSRGASATGRAHSAAAMAKWAVVALSSRGGRRRPGGPLWATRLRSHLGWCMAFRPGRCSGLGWAKRPDGLGSVMKIFKKKG